MTRRIITGLLISSAIISACQRRIPETAPAPTTVSTIPQPLPTPTYTGKWSIVPTDQKLRYRSTQAVALQHTTSPVQPPNSFTTTVDFSITPKRTPSTTTYTVEIQSLQSTAIQSVLHTPFSFSGHLSSNLLKIDALNGVPASSVIDCNTGEFSSTGVVAQTIISIPAQLETGTTWSDSLSTTACTGPVPGVLSITRTYRTLGSTQIGGLEAIILELVEKTSLTGEGSQEQHRVQIRGTGSGKGRLMIDATTGAVISADTDRLALLVVTASGREQQFQQHVNEALVRLQY